MIKRIDISIVPDDDLFGAPLMRFAIVRDGQKYGHQQVLPVDLEPFMFEHIMKRVTAELKEALFDE